jgi:hypothetical protein
MTDRSTRLYSTAEEARRAVDDAAFAVGEVTHPHTYLGGISDEAECYCGLRMPLDENGAPSLTFEEWIDYHDGAVLKSPGGVMT